MTEFSIRKDTFSGTDVDAGHLYNQGISRLIELSNQLWTDYNHHDPGVTLLEVLSYVLSELSFRLDTEIADVLVDGIADTQPAAKQAVLASHFPTAEQVLPAAPLTELDYRKLLTDLKNVENAWLTAATTSLYLNCESGQVSVKPLTGEQIKRLDVLGGYEVLLELSTGLSAEQKQSTLEQVDQTLHAHRNLCEWFLPPKPIKQQRFIVCAEIELSPKVDPVTAYSQVMQVIHHYFHAAITQQHPAADFATKDWSNDVFDGPLLSHGFIADAALQQAGLKTQIRLSDIINLVMDVAGVVAVRDMIVNPEGLKQAMTDKWSVAVAPGKKAALNPQGSRLNFYKRAIPIAYDTALALDTLKQVIRAQQQDNEVPVDYDLGFKAAHSRNLKQYQSAQAELPAVYGLSEAGLPKDSSARRQAQVLQLRGFLAQFDQLALNLLSQAKHIGDLFSGDYRQQHSYFAALSDNFSDWQKLFGDAQSAQQKLNAALHNEPQDLDRRNRFLDFLVARFGEDLTELTDAMLAAFRHTPKASLRYKCEFLDALPELSKHRGLAHNISRKDAYWDTDNVSGLQQRLTRLLGMANHRRRNLGDVDYDVYAEIDSTPDDEFRFRIRNRDNAKILLSSSTNYDSKQAAKTEMRQAILYGTLASQYLLHTARDGRFYFNLVNQDQQVIARRIEYFATKEQAIEAIEDVVQYLSMNYSDEGMYLIEHSLLLPHSDDEPQLPVCIEDGCGECIDPYSYQIHIILPAFGARFVNMDFRRFCESVIRSEVPAHIMPRVCWIDQDHMATLEIAYQDWLAVLHGASRTGAKQKKQSLIDALTLINNVYPVEQLHACGSEQTGFVLGRTSLGTFKEST